MPHSKKGPCRRTPCDGLESHCRDSQKRNRRARDEEPAPGNIQQGRASRSRWAYDLRRELVRLGPPRGRVRRQNPQRREARRLARRAANEIRAGDQFKDREADRPHNSSERAGAGGPGDQMKISGLVFISVATLLSTLATNAQAQQPRKVVRIGYVSSQGEVGESARADAIRLALRE